MSFTQVQSLGKIRRSAPAWIAVAGGTLFATCALLAVLASAAWMVVILAVLAITLIQVVTLRARAGVAVPAPAIVVAALNVVAVLGYLFYRDLAAVAQVSATLPDADVIYRDGALIFAVASLSAWLAALTVRPVGVRSPGARVREVMSAIPSRWALGIGALPAVANLLGYTPGMLMHRAHYLDEGGLRTFVSAGSMSAPIGLTVLAFTVTDPRRAASTRIHAAALLGVDFVVLFAMGTRAISLIPFLTLLGWSQTRTERPGMKGWAVLAAGVTFVLAQLPLNLRGSGKGAGLGPFVHQVVQDPGILVEFRPGALIGNVLFGFPLAGDIYGLRGGTLPLHTFMTTINPLPGSLTDWASVHGTLGVNGSTPFNGIGELSAYGWFTLVGYMAFMGWLLARLQRAAAGMAANLQTIAQLGILGSTAIFTYDLLQYNLRSGLRPVWYIVALVLFLRWYGNQGGPEQAGRQGSHGRDSSEARCVAGGEPG